MRNVLLHFLTPFRNDTDVAAAGIMPSEAHAALGPKATIGYSHPMAENQTPPEALGDRFFWPMVMLLGLGLVVVPSALDVPLSPKVGVGIVIFGLFGWLRERRRRVTGTS